jgi:hypothetical protein
LHPGGRADRRRRVEPDREQGIDRFDAEVFAENRPMLAVFAQSDLPMTRRTGDGVVLV